MEPSVTSQLYDKDKSARYYEERYSQGYMDECAPETKQRIFEIIRELDLPEHGEVLDFGCGNGILTEVVQQALPQWQVYGVDISMVAVENARRRCPQCRFSVSADKAFLNKKFDLLFTHHVLEHVYNLSAVFDEMDRYLKPKSAMLHILPCGNEGSFEYEICLLRKDGINPNLENRFFFEDEGHVRRLKTTQMIELHSLRRFTLAKEYYTHQYYGAINWITLNTIRFIWTLTDTSAAVNNKSRRKLITLRYFLTTLAIARLPASLVVRKFRKIDRTLRDYMFLVGGLLFYVFSKSIDRYYRQRALEEWETKRADTNGSDMVLYFVREGLDGCRGTLGTHWG